MSASKKTVRDACQSWLKAAEQNGLEPSTLKAYRSHVNIHIDPRIGNLLLADVSRKEVREFMDKLQGDGVSRALVKKVMVSLRSIFSEAIEQDWLAQNVALDVKLRRQSRGLSEKVIPTKEELRLIIANAPRSHRAMFVTAIFTGMRISELRGLKWSDVDFDQSVIRVRQRADESGKIGAPKSAAGVRTIPMAPIVLNTLTSWRDDAPESVMKLVFPNSAGKPQNYSNIYNRVFKPMLINNGIVTEQGQHKFGIHALRHAAASLFIEQGWNPKKIQTLMGHASITMTMDTYGHLFEDPEGDVDRFQKLERDLMAA